MLAGISGLISSVSLRRGFAVVGPSVLLLGTGVVTAVQAISAEEGDSASARWRACSPRGPSTTAATWDAGVETFVTPPTAPACRGVLRWSLLLVAAPASPASGPLRRRGG